MASTAVSSDTTDVISCRSLGCKMALRSDDTDLISCRPLEGLDAKMTPVSSDDTDEDVAATSNGGLLLLFRGISRGPLPSWYGWT